MQQSIILRLEWGLDENMSTVLGKDRVLLKLQARRCALDSVI